MVKPVKPEEPRKPYETPVLTVHGTVRDLTQSKGSHGNTDGGFGTHNRTNA